MALYKASQLLHWDILYRTPTGNLLPLRPLNHQCDSIIQRLRLAFGVLTGRLDALDWSSTAAAETPPSAAPPSYQPSPEELQHGYYAEVDIRELTTPVYGHRAIVGAYWLTRNGNPLVWRRGNVTVSQFSRHKGIAEALAAKRGAGYGYIYIEVAYWNDN